MAARLLALMVRLGRSPPPQRWAWGVHMRTVPAVAIAASERWNATLGAGPASLVVGGIVAAAGIGTAECAGGDHDDAASDAQMNTPTRWATNPLAAACCVPFTASATGCHCAQFDAVPGLDCRCRCRCRCRLASSILDPESKYTRPKRWYARPTGRRVCRSPPRRRGIGIMTLPPVDQR
jgi:hypothetical protein